jgi:hypothetical protein
MSSGNTRMATNPREKWDKEHRRAYVPLDNTLVRPQGPGRKRKPEAQRWMRTVIRSRQNIEADAKELNAEPYDWDGYLMHKWLPGNGKKVVWKGKEIDVTT